MKANPNSWHRYLNDFVYGQGYSLEMYSVCPYFWGTLLAFVGLIPAAIFKGIRAPIPEQHRSLVGKILFFVIVGGSILFGLATNFEMTLRVLLVIGVTLLLVGGAVIASIIVAELLNRRPSKKEKVPKEHMVTVMFKAWKNKYCPKLEWE